MTVDEIIDDPIAALDLPDGSIPVSITVIVEYLEPGSESDPAIRRLAITSDEDMTSWTSIGLLHYAIQMESDAIRKASE